MRHFVSAKNILPEVYHIVFCLPTSVTFNKSEASVHSGKYRISGYRYRNYYDISSVSQLQLLNESILVMCFSTNGERATDYTIFI